MSKTALEISEQQFLDLVTIPSGEFLLGSSRGLPLEIPAHPVRITHPFQLGRLPVTQSQWRKVIGQNPSVFSGDGELPVENVSWEDAKAFCAKLVGASGWDVRFPSEAEWEYAYGVGTLNEFYFRDDENRLPDCAWFGLNSRARTHPVGKKKPNDWGLYDMVGTIWEWCEDVWHSDYEAAPGEGSPWLENISKQPRRSLRGGAWNYDAFRSRSAYRSREWKHFATDHFGFRIAVTAQH